MTDVNPEAAAEPHDEPEPSIFDQEEGVDWLLAYQVGLVTDFGVGPSVTLLMSGILVSGAIISGRTYFQETSQLMREANVHGAQDSDAAQTLVSALADAHAGWGEQYLPTRQPEEVRPPSRPTYIHLRIEDVFVPGSRGLKPLPKLSYWRARLASVDAWTMQTVASS